MGFDFDPDRPIYLQIVAEVKKRVARGRYPPGAPLPSVRELARELGVNPNTVSRAHTELERAGLIETRRGQGSRITEDAQRLEEERWNLAAAARDRFVAEIRQLALDTQQAETLLREIREAVRRD